MSCYIINHEEIRKLGYTIAELLNRDSYGQSCDIAVLSASLSSLGNAFMDGFCFMNGRFQPEGIAIVLHHLNAQAYAERYRENDLETFSALNSRRGYSLWQTPEYYTAADGYRCEAPQNWHYALLALIDCWLYQTDEGSTAKSKIRLAVQRFGLEFAHQIIVHDPMYNAARRSL